MRYSNFLLLLQHVVHSSCQRTSSGNAAIIATEDDGSPSSSWQNTTNLKGSTAISINSLSSSSPSSSPTSTKPGPTASHEHGHDDAPSDLLVSALTAASPLPVIGAPVIAGSDVSRLLPPQLPTGLGAIFPTPVMTTRTVRSGSNSTVGHATSIIDGVCYHRDGSRQQCLDDADGEGWASRTAIPTQQTSSCVTLAAGQISIEFDVVYTSTVTLAANASHAQASPGLLGLPAFCTTTRTPSPKAPAPLAASMLGALAFGLNLPKLHGHLLPTMLNGESAVLTLITTAKVPATVYTPQAIPHYSHKGHHNHGLPVGNDHQSVDVVNTQTARTHYDPESGAKGSYGNSHNAFVVTAGGGKVIIDHTTFADIGSTDTPTVSAGGGVFTILPTAVVGQGQTISRPSPAGSQVVAASPTNTVLDHLAVAVSSGTAVIDGTSVAIPSSGQTKTFGGKEVSLGPGEIAIGGHSLVYGAAMAVATNKVVKGGELLTAIGQSIAVLHSTTLTYGPGIKAVTLTVDDDIITVGPSGIVVDGSTIGASNADATDTLFHVVGGATVTERGASVLVINGTTYTVGPGASKTTAIVGGETLTVGPRGINIDTMSFGYPFGPTITATLKASEAATADMPEQTLEAEEEDDSIATSLRPSAIGFLLLLCGSLSLWISL